MNKKMKLKWKTKTYKKNSTKHKVNMAKDDRTLYRPRHDIDTRTYYMC